MKRGEVSHALVKQPGRPVRCRCVVVESENNPLSIMNVFSTHRVKVVEGHGRRAVGAKGAVNPANNNITSAGIDPRFGRKNLFADSFGSHLNCYWGSIDNASILTTTSGCTAWLKRETQSARLNKLKPDMPLPGQICAILYPTSATIAKKRRNQAGHGV